MTTRRKVALAVAFFTAIGVYVSLLRGPKSGPSSSLVHEREDSRRGVSPGRRQAGLPATKAQADQATRTPIPSPRPGYGLVTCDLDIHSAGTLTGNLKQKDQYEGEAILVNDKLVAQVPAGSGAARFEFEVAGGTFAWEGLEDGGSGTCIEGAVDTHFTGLYGRLEGQSFPHARVTGCGSDVAVDGEEFFMTVHAPRECDVWVVVLTETEMAEGLAVQVKTIPGVDSEVVLRYPPASALRPFSAELLEQRREFEDAISIRFGANVAPTPPVGRDEETRVVGD